jgi:hypothetical protein
VIEKLRGLRLSRAAELVETAVEETLTYYAFPEEHWRRIRTNNPLEPCCREVLAGVDRLEHGRNLPHLGRGHVAEDVAVPVHDAPLPSSL